MALQGTGLHPAGELDLVLGDFKKEQQEYKRFRERNLSETARVGPSRSSEGRFDNSSPAGERLSKKGQGPVIPFEHFSRKN